MADKNLPHIPLYIGDWEKDCNMLSLKTEAAWLRIIFKMFSKGKQNKIKIKSKYLQNLWRVTEKEVIEIIEELEDNDICNIAKDGDIIEFECRRYTKENHISKVRSVAKKGKTKNNVISKENENEIKNEQNTDNDNDIDNDNEVKNKSVKTKEIRKLEFIEKVVKAILENSIQINSTEKDKFINYWTESGDKDKLLAFEKEKTFNHKNRLERWIMNLEKYNKNYSPEKLSIKNGINGQILSNR